jgi:hypothetical protein
MQILTAAAEQQDKLVKPPAIPPGPRGAIEAKLRTAGLMEEVRLDADEHPAMAWRHADGEAIGYRITDTGLAAIGVDATAPDALERVRAAGVVEPTAEATMPRGGATESAEGGGRAVGNSAGRNATRAAGGPSRVTRGAARHTAAAHPPGRCPGGAPRLGR